MSGISTIIPVYKHEELFLRNLEHNAPFLKKTEIIIVIDDPASRGLKERIHTLTPQAHVLHNAVNMGFSGSMNRGVKRASNSFLLFLNSDVKLLDTSYKKAVDTLKKNVNLFAVSFAQIEKDKSVVGANTAHLQNGIFEHSGKSAKIACTNLWPEGGSSLVRASYFQALNGYDELYAPFYWEDVDLGFRAWKRGYETVFSPDILVEHHHETTIRSFFSKKTITAIAQRNQFVFMWKNLDHLSFMHLVLYILKHPSLIPAALAACFMLPTILQKRRAEMPFWKKTDEEVLATIHSA
ncbi:MAG: glycosyltransferase [Candidatus Roizmanbacteria bacterium]|nr:glycosyltransferase [Candidatus Roizmanbacteria bacterium]